MAYNEGGRIYKVYTATILQSGTSDPDVTVLENTIGNIVWSRGGAGYYTATLAGAFPAGKTAIFLNDQNFDDVSHRLTLYYDQSSDDGFAMFATSLNGRVEISSNMLLSPPYEGSAVGWEFSDGIYFPVAIEIRVYP